MISSVTKCITTPLTNTAMYDGPDNNECCHNQEWKEKKAYEVLMYVIWGHCVKMWRACLHFVGSFCCCCFFVCLLLLFCKLRLN